MIAASVKDGDAIVDLLLQRGADVNQKSKPPNNSRGRFKTNHSLSLKQIKVARFVFIPPTLLFFFVMKTFSSSMGCFIVRPSLRSIKEPSRDRPQAIGEQAARLDSSERQARPVPVAPRRRCGLHAHGQIVT